LVTAIVSDFRKMAPADRFAIGNFWFPPITDDPLVQGPFRGVGGAGVCLAVTKTPNLQHERNVVDFLMFMTAPDTARLLVERTLADGQPILGPLAVKGVALPSGLAREFAVFEHHGYEKINFRGLQDEQESIAGWAVAAQDLFAGATTLPEFMQENRGILRAALPRLQERIGYDWNPATADHPHAPQVRRNRWNPFQNGSLMVLLMLGVFGLFGAWHTLRARGAARRRTLLAYALLLPGFMLLGLFNYFPAISGLYHAFTHWEEGRPAVFNGLANFERLWHDRAFFRGIGNMLLLLTTGLFKSIVVSFIAAELVLHLTSRRLRYLFRNLFLLPMVAPGMVIILIWKFIYDPNFGVLNQAFHAVGLHGSAHNWLGEPGLALPAIIFVGFPWIGAFGLLIYMAGLMAIPESIYESYTLESRRVLHRIWSIDLPLVRSQTRLLFILTFIGALQDFQTILIFTNGGPGRATTVPALHMYQQAFRFSHYGYGAAIGLVLFLLILLITWINLRFLKKAEIDL
jgi:raffinose/stachyose/melibiose transport system permease protein